MPALRQRVAALSLTAWVFLGSLLSFGMEPLVGRMVVPSFGGAIHVWTTCMMLFQGLLLLGYAYAHLVAPRIGAWHLLVLALGLVQLPLAFDAPRNPEAPIAALSIALLSQLSLPFAVLTTTAVVAQTRWLRSDLGTFGEPYRLYGASNLGSLLALLAYPLAIEPFIGLTAQRHAWSALFVVYLVLGAACFAATRGAGPVPAVAASSGGGARLAWVLLSAAPSALLLATTNHVAHELGSVPLVWVLPLALYFGTFVIAFRDAGSPLYRAVHAWPLWVATQVLALIAFQAKAPVLLLGATLVPFTALCLACHRLLYELRPDAGRLTSYYLWLALGGWVGGTAVTLGAPVLLSGLYEAVLAVGAICVALVLAGARPEARSWRPWGDDAGRRARMVVVLSAIVLVGLVAQSTSLGMDMRARVRTFYGVYRVADRPAGDGPAMRLLAHGQTQHGVEVLEPRGRAGSYYHPGSPLEEVVLARGPGPRRVGLVGLGAGAMVPMADADDTVVVYEIDGALEPLVRAWFSFLDAAVAPTELRVGDARLHLDAEAERGDVPYDVLVVDAFSGDSVPTHLVTREAFATYAARTAPDGLLAVHVSNRYYDIAPILTRHARDLGWAGRVIVTPDVRLSSSADSVSHVMVFARDDARLSAFLDWQPLGLGTEEPWTDDFAPLLRVLRW